MSVFDLSVLGIVALLIALKLLVLAGAGVLAARMLAERVHGRRLALIPVPVRDRPARRGF
jgi:hypothetical protein